VLGRLPRSLAAGSPKEVVEVSALVLSASVLPASTAAFEPNKSLLWTKPDSTWSWVLEPMGEEHTRVVSRLRCRHDPTTLLGLSGLLLMELGDFPMFRKLLLNLRKRSEALAVARGRA
jgi:hypothetical protein